MTPGVPRGTPPLAVPTTPSVLRGRAAALWRPPPAPGPGPGPGPVPLWLGMAEPCGCRTRRGVAVFLSQHEGRAVPSLQGKPKQAQQEHEAGSLHGLCSPEKFLWFLRSLGMLCPQHTLPREVLPGASTERHRTAQNCGPLLGSESSVRNGKETGAVGAGGGRGMSTISSPSGKGLVFCVPKETPGRKAQITVTFVLFGHSGLIYGFR